MSSSPGACSGTAVRARTPGAARGARGRGGRGRAARGDVGPVRAAPAGTRVVSAGRPRRLLRRGAAPAACAAADGLAELRAARRAHDELVRGRPRPRGGSPSSGSLGGRRGVTLEREEGLRAERAAASRHRASGGPGRRRGAEDGRGAAELVVGRSGARRSRRASPPSSRGCRRAAGARHAPARRRARRSGVRVASRGRSGGLEHVEQRPRAIADLRRRFNVESTASLWSGRRRLAPSSTRWRTEPILWRRAEAPPGAQRTL